MTQEVTKGQTQIAVETTTQEDFGDLIQFHGRKPPVIF